LNEAIASLPKLFRQIVLTTKLGDLIHLLPLLLGLLSQVCNVWFGDLDRHARSKFDVF
jgi:hypothetical protein